MPSTIIDSAIFGDFFSSEAMRNVWSDESRTQKYLDIEGALEGRNEKVEAMQKHRPVMLVVLDGWGWREDPADNAVRQARTPAFDQLWNTCSHALLVTSGKDVGTPCMIMGPRLHEHLCYSQRDRHPRGKDQRRGW